MQPSTWNDTNQHWIPQFLLKGFGLKGKSSRVYQLDKETKEINVRKISEVASQKELLTDRDDELMRHIEKRTAPIIDKIRKGNIKINGSDRKALDRLVAAMIQNDPYNGLDQGNMREDIIQTITREVVDAFKSSGGLVKQDDLKEYIEERFSHDYLTLTFDREDNQILDVLGFMGLTANYALKEGAFIVGDSPVLVARNSVEGSPSLRNPGSQVILPINSKSLLVYQWAIPRNLLEKGPPVDKEQALSLNRDYYHESNCRFLYGRTTDSLEQSRMLRLQWTPRTRSTGISDGWAAMESQLREKEEKDRAKRLENREALYRGVYRAVEMARSQQL